MPRLIKRLVPRDDKALVSDYADLMATQPPDAVVIEDLNGVYRWQEDGLIRWLSDIDQLDLNAMCVAFQRGAFTLDEYMRFYRGLGYSLSGFIEIFGDHLGLYEKKTWTVDDILKREG